MTDERDIFRAVKITDRVWWVGAIDWGIRDFHGYLTSRGSSYNAYLIMADKITLVDTVKAAFRDEMFSRIKSVIPMRDIKYIISNHSEMDHSGALVDAIEAIKPEKVFASEMGVKALKAHFHSGHEIIAVKDGERLDLGGANITFLETRMIHWPDSMFSYLAEDSMLISQDGFGMHLASTERFTDEISPTIIEYEAAKYYANILLVYSPRVKQVLERVQKLGLKIDIIAPDHGPVWKKDVAWALGRYRMWSERATCAKAVVAYDTMWNSTAAMVRAISEGITVGGARAVVMPLRSSHRSDVMTELLDAGALIVGSPTLNNSMFPTVADFLCYAKGLKPTGLIGQAFGSYGWTGEGPEQVRAVLEEMKVNFVGETIKVKYVPDDESLKKCYNLGLEIAKKLKEVTPK